MGYQDIFADIEKQLGSASQSRGEILSRKKQFEQLKEQIKKEEEQLKKQRIRQKPEEQILTAKKMKALKSQREAVAKDIGQLKKIEFDIDESAEDIKSQQKRIKELQSQGYKVEKTDDGQLKFYKVRKVKKKIVKKPEKFLAGQAIRVTYKDKSGKTKVYRSQRSPEAERARVISLGGQIVSVQKVTALGGAGKKFYFKTETVKTPVETVDKIDFSSPVIPEFTAPKSFTGITPELTKLADLDKPKLDIDTGKPQFEPSGVTAKPSDLPFTFEGAEKIETLGGLVPANQSILDVQMKELDKATRPTSILGGLTGGLVAGETLPAEKKTYYVGTVDGERIYVKQPKYNIYHGIVPDNTQFSEVLSDIDKTINVTRPELDKLDDSIDTIQRAPEGTTWEIDINQDDKISEDEVFSNKEAIDILQKSRKDIEKNIGQAEKQKEMITKLHNLGYGIEKTDEGFKYFLAPTDEVYDKTFGKRAGAVFSLETFWSGLGGVEAGAQKLASVITGDKSIWKAKEEQIKLGALEKEYSMRRTAKAGGSPAFPVLIGTITSPTAQDIGIITFSGGLGKVAKVGVKGAKAGLSTLKLPKIFKTSKTVSKLGKYALTGVATGGIIGFEAGRLSKMYQENPKLFYGRATRELGVFALSGIAFKKGYGASVGKITKTPKTESVIIKPVVIGKYSGILKRGATKFGDYSWARFPKTTAKLSEVKTRIVFGVRSDVYATKAVAGKVYGKLAPTGRVVGGYVGDTFKGLKFKGKLATGELKTLAKSTKLSVLQELGTLKQSAKIGFMGDIKTGKILYGKYIKTIPKDVKQFAWSRFPKASGRVYSFTGKISDIGKAVKFKYNVDLYKVKTKFGKTSFGDFKTKVTGVFKKKTSYDIDFKFESFKRGETKSGQPIIKVKGEGLKTTYTFKRFIQRGKPVKTGEFGFRVDAEIKPYTGGGKFTVLSEASEKVSIITGKISYLEKGKVVYKPFESIIKTKPIITGKIGDIPAKTKSIFIQAPDTLKPTSFEPILEKPSKLFEGIFSSDTTRFFDVKTGQLFKTGIKKTSGVSRVTDIGSQIKSTSVIESKGFIDIKEIGTYKSKGFFYEPSKPSLESVSTGTSGLGKLKFQFDEAVSGVGQVVSKQVSKLKPIDTSISRAPSLGSYSPKVRAVTTGVTVSKAPVLGSYSPDAKVVGKPVSKGKPITISVQKAPTKYKYGKATPIVITGLSYAEAYGFKRRTTTRYDTEKVSDSYKIVAGDFGSLGETRTGNLGRLGFGIDIDFGTKIDVGRAVKLGSALQTKQVLKPEVKTVYSTTTVPVDITPVPTPVPIKPKESKLLLSKEKIDFRIKKKKKKKLVSEYKGRSILADPFLAQRSQILFGKATAPRYTKKLFKKGILTGFRIPTVELIEESKGSRKVSKKYDWRIGKNVKSSIKKNKKISLKI